MKKASALFREEDRQAINEAVREAESKTAAEIITVVATDSGRYDRPEDVVGLFFGLGCLIVAWAFFQRHDPSAGGWGEMPLTLQLPSLVAILGVGFLAGTLTAMKVTWLRRLFTPKKQMHDEVMARARQIFFDERVHHTSGSTGFLIYLSLYERLAVVLADQEIVAVFGQYQIDELCHQLIADLRQGDVTAALCGAIREAGERLGKELPRQQADANELADALVTID
jgi:putative membrane protein